MNILNKIGNNLWKSNSSIYSSLIKKTSVITLSVGIFSILISSSVLDGFQFSIKEKIFDFSGHLNISNFGNGLSFKNYPIDTNSGIGSNYQEVNEIEDAIPFILLSALIEKNNKMNFYSWSFDEPLLIIEFSIEQNDLITTLSLIVTFSPKTTLASISMSAFESRVIIS